MVRDASDGAVERPDAGLLPPPDALDARDAAPSHVPLSGSLRVGSTYFVDTDNADPQNPHVANDATASAQDIGNPCVVAGHLDPGSQDAADVFRVSLGEGQAVVLDIARDAAGLPDFDLRLFDTVGTLVADSLGTGPVEVVQAPSAGSYFVEVRPFGQDAGLYTLTVGMAYGTNVLFAGADRLSTFFPMVTGEVLVGEHPGSAPDRRERRRRIAASERGKVLSSGEHGPMRVRLPAFLSSQGIRARRMATIEAVKRLRARGDVRHASPNYVRQIHAAAPDDPRYPEQWSLPVIDLLGAWDYSRGDGVTVAVLDTGIVAEHPDLTNPGASSQVAAGYDMISDPDRARDGDGRDPSPADPGDLRFPTGSSWHGTHVAGIVAAATDNATGIAGVAPGARIMPVRVIGVGGGTDDDIVQAILYAAGLPNATGALPPSPADIITMSFGGPGRSTAIEDAVAQARAAGAIVIASSGNENADASLYSPAGEPGVVTVGAVDLSRERAFYSNFGGVLDVVAPGGDESKDDDFDGRPDGITSLVYSNGGDTLYASYQGTSMAAPHVAGIAALMKALDPSLGPDTFDELLAGQRPGIDPITEDLGGPGWDPDHGHGLLNAALATLAASALVSNPVPAGPLLQVTPRELDFGSVDDALPLTVGNIGAGTLSVTSVTADGPWVSVAPGAVGDNVVSIDRAQLTDGVHTATITVDSSGGTAGVRVRAVVGPGLPTGGDVGRIYVLLLDPDTKQPRYQAVARPSDGYAFSFVDIPVGSYRLVAGTDLDDDGFIDDEGEIFGGYPVSSALDVIDVGPETPEVTMTVRVR